ncbi:response regulator [Algoriphagus algorifonticola]|uniref:response regulator n=1 Tax=Algoriphagus algorifonticola TaxID=2593007 RepID=UPI00164364E7|nr:response regulator [Algoriphagus algorifonticola]
MKITLVEDNLGDVLLTKEILEDIGLDYQLITFQEGESAIQYFEEISKENLGNSSPDLVILDINLPQKSGLEILQFIRKKIPNPKFKIVFLTSSTASKDVAEIQRLQADGHFVKPLDPRLFKHFLSRYEENLR